ncbi:hypothetical protein ABEB36_014542 [Hypothenemus hampei]|uniref:Envelope protein n=1 Tax=Hypothenemus hampei TaxID=57062 RepID=A0ABD1E2E3_HYPHA
MNFLGSGIKFITGNLDDTDLEIITQNFETIKHNQLNAIHKINDLSSFAGNIMNEFQKTLRDINENSETIAKKLSTINNELNIILSMQDQYFEINQLIELLEKILRVFSFAHMETFDIEIITSKEIDEIWYYLKQHYPKNALWSIGHMTELTLICKARLLIFDDMVILAIKILIFEQSVCNLKFVYPIPNNESKIVISPNPLIDSCSLLQDCQYASVQNSYHVHTLTYKNALLMCTRAEEIIYENCFKFDKIRLGGCHIIRISLPTITNFKMSNLTLDLKIKHLEDPSQIQEDLLEPIHLEGLVPQENVHFIIGISIVLVSSIINEDVEKTQDGGEISPH